MSSFSLDVSRFVNATNREIEDFTRLTLMDATSKIIANTPVDSGRLRGNWQVSWNFPKDETVDTLDRSGAVTVGKANEVIGRMIKPSFWITNNLPYAYKIEFEGHSSEKAPNGMLRVALADTVGLRRV